jgi:ABC-type transport system involved in multi-copper enzyme maturation permease subunit
MLFTIVIPSTCISSEKESRSWPLLLTTTLNDREILFGKFVGALRRCLPVWLLLLGHIIVFSLTGTIHPIAVPYMALLIFWVTIFLCGSGLYFSSCCKRTTTAVILNFALAFTIWAIVPLLLFFVAGAQTSQDYLDTNPVVHAGTIMEATIGKSRLRTFYWIGSGRRDASGTMTWILICMGVHILAGSLFALRAKRRFRRKIF